MKREDVRFRKANPVSLSQLLAPLATEMGIDSDIFFKKIRNRWQDIVGPANARNTKPLSFDGSILTVAVSSPAWNTQARYLKSSFLRNIERFEPEDGTEVRDIRFVLESNKQE
jgi:predicted nucleic acid-binding Zn ribbon protein